MPTMSCRFRRARGVALGAVVVALSLMGVLFSPFLVDVAGADGFTTVSGTVRDSNGDPVAGVRVGIYALSAAFVVTNSSGAYAIPNVARSNSPYDVQLLVPCTRDQSKRVVVNGPKTVDFTVATTDTQAGYTCAPSSFPYIDGTTDLLLTGDDNTTSTALPFTFSFFGQAYTQVNVDTNGYVTFGAPASSSFFNVALSNSAGPNNAIYAFWDDLIIGTGSSVRVATGGVAPNRFFAIEWHAVSATGDPNVFLSFETVLFETGRIVLNYKDISLAAGSERIRGSSATVGIENAAGTAAFQRSFNQPVLDNGYAIEFVKAPK